MAKRKVMFYRKDDRTPVKVDGRNLVVAVSDPESLDIEQQLGFISKRDLKRVIATPADISGAIAWYYQDEAAAG